ncbi:acyltransferase family protein [Solwaraspora sp. WMMD792]|uniref:acyltransferase family protein n=1 Tax=Solwaraspora sp. WMMD792 TaxID=3016099 RepID=UPI002417717A|nr:acyltransferase family protein [Solwaraspora sp. WMMD792]MDG4772412.1 acyltransferase family protein [Solwaraspora sp. WMMD792]
MTSSELATTGVPGRAANPAGAATTAPVREKPPGAAEGAARGPARPVITGGRGHGTFRRDIEGLRAVAVLLVVLYHAGVPLFGGGYVGVDVFYVISGFVVTSVLLREYATDGTISILGFYARRARRLLPAAVLVLITTLVAAWWWLPLQLQWIATQAIASAAYCVNFLLARNSVDYLDTMRRESPLEHYWSLAVEEQFYLCWPLLLLALLGLPRLLRWRPARSWWRPGDLRLVSAVVAGVAVLSFALCVWLTATSPGYAYFGSPARAWQLLAGVLIALGAGAASRLPARLAAAMAWTGLAAVLAAALLFDSTTPFPGYPALLPVAGAALVIAAGCAPHSGGAGGLLALRPMQWIGRLSYSWYLWHWPFLVIGAALLGGHGTIWQNLGLVGGALVAAAGTYLLVEAPLRRRRRTVRPWRTIGLAAVASAAVVAVAVPALATKPTLVGPGRPVDTAAMLAASADVERDLARLVAASVETGPVPANLTPPLPEVTTDIPAVFHDGCVVLRITDTGSDHPCEYGDPAARQTVVLFGDSHAGSWFPAVRRLADERDWRLVVMVKGFCSAASVRFHLDSVNRPYDECVQWREQALRRIGELRPAMVVTSSTNYTFGDPVGGYTDRDQVWTDGWARTVDTIRSTGSEVVLIGDVPWLPATVVDCLALHLTDARTCHGAVSDVVLEPRRRQMIADAARDRGALVVDPTPWFCTSTVCPALVGNVVTLRDGNHISATYSRLLWRALDEQIGLLGA